MLCFPGIIQYPVQWSTQIGMYCRLAYGLPSCTLSCRALSLHAYLQPDVCSQGLSTYYCKRPLTLTMLRFFPTDEFSDMQASTLPISRIMGYLRVACKHIRTDWDDVVCPWFSRTSAKHDLNRCSAMCSYPPCYYTSFIAKSL